LGAEVSVFADKVGGTTLAAVDVVDTILLVNAAARCFNFSKADFEFDVSVVEDVDVTVAIDEEVDFVFTAVGTTGAVTVGTGAGGGATVFVADLGAVVLRLLFKAANLARALDVLVVDGTDGFVIVSTTDVSLFPSIVLDTRRAMVVNVPIEDFALLATLADGAIVVVFEFTTTSDFVTDGCTLFSTGLLMDS